jgi:hypothetical protein
MTTTRPEAHNKALKSDADRLRDHLLDLKTDDELLFWAATAAAGSISDKVQQVAYELDAIREVLEARGIWDDEEEVRI